MFLLIFGVLADFEDFKWPALQEWVVCSRRLYGMNCRVDRALEFRQNGFRIAQEPMEIFRFFCEISPILLILRISTGQRFRKEGSVQDANSIFLLMNPLLRAWSGGAVGAIYVRAICANILAVNKPLWLLKNLWLCWRRFHILRSKLKSEFTNKKSHA